MSADDRLTLASRIAAVSLLCRKATISIGPAETSSGTDQVTMSELTGRDTVCTLPGGTVTEDHVRETLGTGLFSSRGAHLMGFAHQSYGEFLAARYLDVQGATADRTMCLLRHPGDPEGRIVPQLYETAAWVASYDPEVFATIARNEPHILLRCDEGSLSPERRAELVDSFLKALDEQRANDRDWDLHRQYRKLKHGGLAEQLRPWVADGEEHTVARRAAIDIAEACLVTELQSELAHLALNQSEHNYLRSTAARAVAAIGDGETRSRLRPLALGQAGNDPQDQLKGNGLRAVWPGEMTAEELFDHLSLPKQTNFFGAYRDFADYELCKHLDVAGLPRALRWLEGHAANRQVGFAFDHLADQIIVLAWKHMDDANVLRALAGALAAFLQHHSKFVDQETMDENLTLFDDTGKRRRIAGAIVEQGIDPEIANGLVVAWGWPRLLRDDDFDWCVEQLLSSISKRTEPVWAELLWRLFIWGEPTGRMFDTLVDARDQSATLRENSTAFFTPIALDSEQAQKLRGQHEQIQQLKQRTEPELLEWLPRDRIACRLEQYEKGHEDAWWIVLREMTLEDTSQKYGDVFDPDITRLPGWSNSDGPTQGRILDAAEGYLSGKSDFNMGLLVDGSSDETDIAAYKAFLVLSKFRPERMPGLGNDVWAHWVPVLFGPFGLNDNKDAQRALISAAYERVPDRVAEVFVQFVRRKVEKDDKYLSALELVEHIWDGRIADAAHSILPEAETKPMSWRRLLSALVEHCDARSVQLAKDKLPLASSSDNTERQLAVQAGLVLIRSTGDATWPMLWPVLQEQESFGRELIMEVAYELGHSFDEFACKLTEDDIAALFVWLAQQFPYCDDPHHGGAYSPTKDDNARELRNGLIRTLEQAGTPAACRALERAVSALPKLDWLKSVLLDARQNTLRSTWRPLRSAELLQFMSEPQSTLVRDAGELEDVLVQALEALAAELQGETPAAPDLWDELPGKQKYRPKDEGHFCDWVKRHLDSELQKRAIVVAREVEIRRGEGSGTGENTDIHVTALVREPGNGGYEQVRVIIEGKGCWHREVKTAMKDQLVGRYLKDNQCTHGIYLVGWYECDQWDTEDSRRKRAPDWSLQEAKAFFENQAQTLSGSGYTVRAIVLNTALR